MTTTIQHPMAQPVTYLPPQIVPPHPTVRTPNHQEVCERLGAALDQY